MFYFKQFEQFNPKSDYVPAHPFTYLPDIASRARIILRNLTLEQMTLAAEKLSHEIECYFEDEKDKGIIDLKERLEAEGRQEEFELYFEWDGGSEENGSWKFKDEMLEELDEIPTAGNCSEVDALKSIIELNSGYLYFLKGGYESEPDVYLDFKNYELFAVLSLWLLADAIKWSLSDNKMKNDSIAGEYAIKAMDAICQAEHLREVEWLTDTFHQSIAVSVKNQEEMRGNLKAELDAHEQAKKSERAKQLNEARHAATNSAKEIVTKEWAKSKNDFPSAEKAGSYYADWLVTEKHVKKITPRTVTSWIREHAKLIGVKFR